MTVITDTRRLRHAWARGSVAICFGQITAPRHRLIKTRIANKYTPSCRCPCCVRIGGSNETRKRRRARSPGVTLCSRWNVQMQMFIQIRQELFLRGCKCTPRTCRGFSSYINIRFRPSVQGLRRTNVRRTFRPCVSIRHARCRRRRTRTAWGGGRRSGAPDSSVHPRSIVSATRTLEAGRSSSATANQNGPSDSGSFVPSVSSRPVASLDRSNIRSPALLCGSSQIDRTIRENNQWYG